MNGDKRASRGAKRSLGQRLVLRKNRRLGLLSKDEDIHGAMDCCHRRRERGEMCFDPGNAASSSI